MTIELPEPAAHMYPLDLAKFETCETFATAFSVAVGCHDEESERLMRISDFTKYVAAIVTEERNRWVGPVRALLAAHDAGLARTGVMMRECGPGTLTLQGDAAVEFNAIQALRYALAQVEKEA